MLKTLIIFLIIVAGVIVGPMLAGHQGLVFFQVAGYRIKMSFTTFVIAEILLFLVIYFCYGLICKITGSRNIFGRFLRFIFPNKSAKKVANAQLMLLEGNYKKAEKLFTQAAKSANNQTLVYLQAAQAAIDGNDLIAANQLLEKAALTCTEKEKLAFQIVQVKLQINNNELQAAKVQVEMLLNDNPRHAQILRLAYNVYDKLNDFQAITDIIPAMYKTQVYSENQIDQLKQQTYLSLISQLANSPDRTALQDWWKTQPKVIKNNLIYQKAVAKYLVELGQVTEAEKLQGLIAKNSAI